MVLLSSPCLCAYPPLNLPFSSSYGDFLSNCSSSSSIRDSLVLVSAHSNPRILKSSLRSRYGESLSPYYDTREEEDDDEIEEEEEEDDDDIQDDDCGQMEETGPKPVRFRLQGDRQGMLLPGSQRPTKGGRRKKFLKDIQSLQQVDGCLDVKNSPNPVGKRNIRSVVCTPERQKGGTSADVNVRREIMARECIGDRFSQLSEDLALDDKSLLLLDYLTTFGLKESHLIQMYERHMPCLQINVASAQERLDYLLSVGVKERDFKRILLRQPQILGYTVEKNLKSHVKFLVDMGIPQSKLGQIISAAPSLFSYSVENSLKPTVRYLVEEVGIKNNDVAKVVQLSPQILVQRIDTSWKARYSFFSKELGAPRDSVVRMVTKHPQLLHYSIEEGLLPRINFLRSIGMQNSEILKVLTSLAQVLSLSLEDNLKPKYMYLTNELGNEVQSLTKYPMYLSLSLDRRIRPRHRFLVSLKKAPKGPFPLQSLVPTDECFCQQWAKTSLDHYLAFRQRLLLKDFAKKYERQI